MATCDNMTDILDGCDVCGGDHCVEQCPELGYNEPGTSLNTITRARATLPTGFVAVDHDDGRVSVIVTQSLPARTKLGPYEAPRTTHSIEGVNAFVLKVLVRDSLPVCLNTSRESDCNWLCLVSTASSLAEQNCMALQIGTDIYYMTTRDVAVDEPLKVWYAPHYAKKLGYSPQPTGLTNVLLNCVVKDQTSEDVSGIGLDHTSFLDDPLYCNQRSPSPKKSLEDVSGKRTLYPCLEHGCSLLFNQRADLLTHNEAHRLAPTPDLETPGEEALGSTGDEASPLRGLNRLRSGYEAAVGPSSGLSLLACIPPTAHIRHKAGGPHECSQCMAVYDDLKEMAKHVRDHVLDSSRQDRRRRRGAKRGRADSTEEAEEDGAKALVIDAGPDFSADTPRTSARIRGKAKRGSSGRPADDIYVTYIPKRKRREKKGEAEEAERGGRTLLPHQIKVEPTDASPAKPNKKKRGAPAKTKRRSPDPARDEASPDEASPGEDLLSGGGAAKGEPWTVDSLIHTTAEASGEEAMELAIGAADGEFLMGAAGEELVMGDITGLSDHVADNSEEVGGESQGPTTGGVCEDIAPQGDDVTPRENANKVPGEKKKNIIKHRVVVKSDRRSYLCELCNEQRPFSGMPEVESHLLSHMDMKKCPQCAVVYSLKKEHTCHKEGEATVKGEPGEPVTSHKCDKCPRVFADEEALGQHTAAEHVNLQCPKCNRRFVRKRSMAYHDCEWSEERVYFCEFCGGRFFKQEYLARHMAAHTGEFSCEKCSNRYTRKESLMRHWAKCMPEEVLSGRKQINACALCHKAFMKESSLEHHRKLHEEEFKCKDCLKAFARQWTLENHQCLGVTTQDDQLMYRCGMCEKTFLEVAQLRKHLDTHRGRHTCDMCSQGFLRKPQLLKHLVTCAAAVQVKNGGQIECTMCPEVFADVHVFKAHIYMHTHPFKCDNCDRMFKRETALAKHVDTCLPLVEGERAECPVCQKVFRTQIQLNRHKSVHDEPKYPCAACGQRFHRIDFYNKHACHDQDGHPLAVEPMAKKLPSCGSLICPTCGNSFSSAGNLNKHMVTHGEKGEECEVCGKKFHHRVALREHQHYVHTDQYRIQCKVCGKKLKSRNSLYGHMRQFHSGDVTLYHCEECNKAFCQKGNLKKHMLTHSDVKRYKCKFCGKKFKFPEQIRRHELWHTTGARFKCDLCDKGFIMEFEIRKHMNTVHGGLTYVCCYCNTDCHHFHSMKRHLGRRHFDIKDWQETPNEFVRALAIKRADYEKTVKKEDGPGAMLGPQQTLVLEGLPGEQGQTLGQLVITSSSYSAATDSGLLMAQGGDALGELNPGDLTQTMMVFPQQGGDAAGGLTAGDGGGVLQAMPTLIEHLTGVKSQGDAVSQARHVILPDSLMGGHEPVILAEVQGMTSDGEAFGLPQTVIIQSDDQDLERNGVISEEVAQALRSLSMQGMLERGEQQTITIGDISSPRGQSIPIALSADGLGNPQGVVIVPMASDSQEGAAEQSVEL